MTQVTITESLSSPFTGNRRNYMTVDGYTKSSGAPMDYKVRVANSKRWYRVYCYQISNSGTCFIKTKESDFTVISNDYDIKG